jgi:glycosyltransferase involved in cell wall biosynthesis
VRALRLLHVVANRWWTGSAEPALDLARVLAERGHQVAFACIRGDALEARARAAGLAPVPGPSLERTARPWVLREDVRALRRLVRERGIELVHAHQSHDHWLAAIALRGTPARLVRTVHHRRAVRRGPALRWLWRRTDAVIAVSAGIAAAIREAGLARPGATVVLGAVDARRFTPDADGSAVRAELGLAGAGPIVGCVARLVPGRGHDVLLRAVARLRRRRPGLRLLLGGRGEGRPAIEGLVGELGLADLVVFAGYRRDDLPRVLAAMDCFALLGAGSEESGRAVLEAMAAGRPVVAGRFGAMPETVVDGETGWLVDPRPDQVAERVAAILADPGRARAMGVAGRQRVTTLFTPERRAAAVEAVYAGVVSPAGPAGRGTLGPPPGPC